jgi:hypothetical protein
MQPTTTHPTLTTQQWEITLFDQGVEVGTWEYPTAPAIGVVYGDCVVVAIRAINADSFTADVEIQYL